MKVYFGRFFFGFAIIAVALGNARFFRNPNDWVGAVEIMSAFIYLVASMFVEW